MEWERRGGDREVKVPLYLIKAEVTDGGPPISDIRCKRCRGTALIRPSAPSAPSAAH